MNSRGREGNESRIEDDTQVSHVFKIADWK